jgi:putative transposase
VWSTDITYVRLAHGFAYLVAVIDWYSRKVLSWRISNSMDASFCVDCLEEALRLHGTPEVFNSARDRNSRASPSRVFSNERASQSAWMAGGARSTNIFVERLWRTIKYQDIYLNGYANMGELMLGLTAYIAFYNEDRFHQALGNDTPGNVYRAGTGGGAMILEKYGISTATAEATTAPKAGQRRTAACEISTA